MALPGFKHQQGQRGQLKGIVRSVSIRHQCHGLPLGREQHWFHAGPWAEGEQGEGQARQHGQSRGRGAGG